jgi:hypothetical protein
MATYRESFNLAQRLLQDPLGLKWKEGALFPFIVEALRACQRRCAENGMQILRDIQLVTLSQGTTSIGLTGGPPNLDSDFVLPWQLEEKIGGTTGKYQPMDKDENLLPDVDQTSRLRLWNWRGGAILFIGATRAVDIRISYEKELTAPQFLTETIPIIGAASAIAYKTAELAGASGQEDKFEDAIAGVISSEVRANQFKPVRRIPYRYR